MARSLTLRVECLAENKGRPNSESRATKTFVGYVNPKRLPTSFQFIPSENFIAISRKSRYKRMNEARDKTVEQFSTHANNREKRLAFLTRRQCLQVGLLGSVGLGLPDLLRARPAGKNSDKSCIFLMLSGGPSQIDTFDPKPDAAAEIRGPYQSIATRVPGVRFTEKLPRLAALADRFCLLRTLSHKTADHVEGAHVCLSGQSDGSRRNNTPYFGSVMAKVKPSPHGVPSYVWLHNLLVGTKKLGRNESGGLLGPAYAPFRIGNDLDTPAVPDFRVKAFDSPDGMTAAEVRDRFELLSRIEQTAGPSLSVSNDMQRLQERALDLVTSPEARRAFDIHQEPTKVRDRYGRHPLGQYLLLSRRLIEAGVRLVSVVGCPGNPPGFTEPPVRQLWDMHDEYFVGRDNMYGTGPYGLGLALPRLDESLSALMEDLTERGLLDNTLVVVVGEFGRTPKFEGQGRGRGHWPYCYPALLAGAGVRRGFVSGSSDQIGAYVKSGQPIAPETFGATIYHALGVAPETRPDARNLAYRISDGEPMLELFK